MPSLTFDLKPRSGGHLRMLCLGAHADDIEIGCGGTIFRLLHSCPGTEVDWVVFTSKSDREREARRAAAAFLENAGASRVIVHDFEDGFLPYRGEAVSSRTRAMRIFAS